MKQATVIRIVVVLAIVIALEAVSRSGWVRVGLLDRKSVV